MSTSFVAVLSPLICQPGDGFHTMTYNFNYSYKLILLIDMQIMVATFSFGMGIDKQNVRQVGDTLWLSKEFGSLLSGEWSLWQRWSTISMLAVLQK